MAFSWHWFGIGRSLSGELVWGAGVGQCFAKFIQPAWMAALIPNREKRASQTIENQMWKNVSKRRCRQSAEG